MESITSEKGDTVENISGRIKKKLADLEETIEAEKRRREEETARITESIEQELNKMYAEFESQKKMRDQNVRKVDGMIRDV